MNEKQTDLKPNEPRIKKLSAADLNLISLRFPLKLLRKATSNFSKENKLGHGANGQVFKGRLENGTDIAVKVIEANKSIGFVKEIRVLSKFRHPNLVTLMGFAALRSQQFLVYEYLEGGDLSSRLLTQDRPLYWEQRLQICFEAARGLAYMHSFSPRVFHRDIKSSNILLGRFDTPKLADFGLACMVKKAEGKIVQRAEGTPGYADPSYITNLKVTEQTEVYSLGIVLLEILTSHPPAIYTKCLVDGNYQTKLKYLLDEIDSDDPSSILYLVDPVPKFPQNVKVQLALLAFRCISRDNSLRPSTAQVVDQLAGLIKDSKERLGVPSTDTLFTDDFSPSLLFPGGVALSSRNSLCTSYSLKHNGSIPICKISYQGLLLRDVDSISNLPMVGMGLLEEKMTSELLSLLNSSDFQNSLNMANKKQTYNPPSVCKYNIPLASIFLGRENAETYNSLKKVIPVEWFNCLSRRHVNIRFVCNIRCCFLKVGFKVDILLKLLMSCISINGCLVNRSQQLSYGSYTDISSSDCISLLWLPEYFTKGNLPDEANLLSFSIWVDHRKLHSLAGRILEKLHKESTLNKAPVDVQICLDGDYSKLKINEVEDFWKKNYEELLHGVKRSPPAKKAFLKAV